MMNVSDKAMYEYDRQIEWHERELAKRKRSRSRMAATFPQYFPASIQPLVVKCGGWLFIHGFGRMIIFLPWLPDVADKIALELELFGWKKYHEEDRSRLNKNGKPEMQLFYRHPYLGDYDVSVDMDSTMSGSCKLTQVGIKEVPVWQVKCE